MAMMNRVLHTRFLSPFKVGWFHSITSPVFPRSPRPPRKKEKFSNSSLCFSSQTPLLSQFASHGRSDCWIPKMCTAHVRAPPIRRFSSEFSSSSTSQDLTSKKCVPCDMKDIRPMSEQAANELLAQVQGWNLLSEDGVMKLHRSWKVKSFTKGLEFFQVVADVAEAEGHHPDLHLVGWNNVKIDIWTHSVGGLTENDFILAAKINSLTVEHLLRRKAAAY